MGRLTNRTAPLIGLVALVLALGLVACGKSNDDEKEVRARVNAFYQALGARDADGVCGSISRERKRALNKAASGTQGLNSCRDSLRFAFIIAGKAFKNAGKAKITGVRVNGKRAVATVVYRGRKGGVGLVKEDGDWLVSSFDLKKL